MSKQKRITAFFCEKTCDTVQHIQSSSSEGREEVNSALAEPEDLDEDEPIQADGQPTDPNSGSTSAKKRKLEDHQGRS